VKALTNKTTDYDVHTPTHLKSKLGQQLKRISSIRNMPIAEKPSKVIPTILTGKLIHYSNSKPIKVKSSKQDLKPNRVGTITLTKTT
jgi:hypothetical protein